MKKNWMKVEMTAMTKKATAIRTMTHRVTTQDITKMIINSDQMKKIMMPNQIKKTTTQAIITRMMHAVIRTVTDQLSETEIKYVICENVFRKLPILRILLPSKTEEKLFLHMEKSMWRTLDIHTIFHKGNDMPESGLLKFHIYIVRETIFAS